jgi:NAD(P)-dependent dehydrogenase (short-subunit alcohol dehydrogenase family)
MDKILASPHPRIVSVSSNGTRFGGIRWTDINFGNGRNYKVWDAYGQSKTANNLFAIGLAQRLGNRGLYAFSLHPGMVTGTNLIQGTYAPPEQFLKDLQKTEEEYGTIFSHTSQSEAEGESKTDENSVQTHLLTAFSPELEKQELNGQHFLDAHLVNPYTGENPAWARDQIDADRLWLLSESLVGQEFSYKD